MTPRCRRLFRRAGACLLVLALAGLGAGLLRDARRWQLSHQYPLQLDAEEGFILNQALTLIDGHSIYPPLNAPPWVVGNYTPLFPAAYAGVHRLTLGPRARPSSLALGRGMAQTCAVLCGLLLMGIVVARGGGWLAGSMAGLLLLSAWETLHWSAFARVDFPALALTLGGFGLFLTARRRWMLALAAAVLVAAAFTRQTAILAPLAAAAALARNDRRGLAWFLGVYAGLGLLVFAILQAATGGEFWRHTVVYNLNVMDWTMWRRLLKNEVWFFHGWWLAALALTALAMGFLRRREPLRTDRPHARGATALFALLATVSIANYAKVGAAPNYLLEPLAAWALWGMESYGRLARHWRPGRHGTALVLGTLAVLYTLHAARPWTAPPVRAAYDSQTGILPTDPGPARALIAQVARTRGDVFTEDPALALLAGKRVWLQPFIMSQLAREGRWDPAPFVQMMRDQRFSLLMTTTDLTQGGPDYERYTPAMTQAVRERYRLTGAVGLGPNLPGYLWDPQSAPASR